MTIEHFKLTRRWGALVVGALGLMLAGMLSATNISHPAPEPAVRPASTVVRALQNAITSKPGASIRLADESEVTQPAVSLELAQGSPELRLIAIYRLIAQNRMGEALLASDALTRSAPNFKLAQLVHADLLSARFAPLGGFGEGAAGREVRAVSPELALLRDEAKLRIRALQERPLPNTVPDEFVLLPASVRYAVAVDTSRARLYLFENGERGTRLIDDYYISVGKQGVDKLVEGDQKTPLGVYFITDRLDARSLEDRFGAGALPLNYPNVYDKSRGRTGSGILVHGVPSNTYSRPPLDSDGCVAMANEDLLKLARQLPQRDTPVIITRKINWVSANGMASPDAAAAGGSATSTRDQFMQRIKQWQQARLKSDRDGLLAMYGDNASPQQDSEAAARFRQRLNAPPGSIDDISVLTWHDERDVMVVTFREVAAARGTRDRVMRQYWSRADSKDWRIVAEGPVR